MGVPKLAMCLAALMAVSSAVSAVSAAPGSWNRKLAGAKPAGLLGMRDAEQKKELRILAFGDSITEGWIDTIEQKHPYTWQLESTLRQRLTPKGINLVLVNGGVGSAGVLDRLNDEFYSRLRVAHDAGKPYHYAVFLAGVNDILLQNRTSGDIIKRMKELWAAAAKEGTTVVVIPTLPTNVSFGEPTRKDLVSKIKSTIGKQKKQGDQSLQLLDLEKQFDWWSMSPEQRSKIFDDGVHLTDYGYQQFLSGLIYDALVKILQI